MPWLTWWKTLAELGCRAYGDTLDAGSGLSSTAPAVFASAAAAGRFAGNALMRRVEPVRLLSVGALTTGAGTLVAAMAGAPWLGLAGIAVAGLGSSVCAPTLVSLAGAWAGPQKRAAAVSTVTTLAYLGFLVGPGRSRAGVVADVPVYGPDRGGRRRCAARCVGPGSATGSVVRSGSVVRTSRVGYDRCHTVEITP